MLALVGVILQAFDDAVGRVDEGVGGDEEIDGGGGVSANGHGVTMLVEAADVSGDAHEGGGAEIADGDGCLDGVDAVVEDEDVGAEGVEGVGGYGLRLYFLREGDGDVLDRGGGEEGSEPSSVVREKVWVAGLRTDTVPARAWMTSWACAVRARQGRRTQARVVQARVR